jgi:hypothetical protein
MDIKLFLESLPLLRHPAYYGVLNGLGDDFVKWEEKDTTPLNRASALDLSTAPAEIQTLYTEYDLSNIHMLWTSFLSEPRQLKEGWCFADLGEALFDGVAAGRVLVMTPQGRIEAYTEPLLRSMERWYLGSVAKDMESYLEAILCAQMNKSHFASGFCDNPAVRAKVEPIAKLCTVIAGGDEYHEFWSGLLGS